MLNGKKISKMHKKYSFNKMSILIYVLNQSIFESKNQPNKFWKKWKQLKILNSHKFLQLLLNIPFNILNIKINK